jgi:hypothetical protein
MRTFHDAAWLEWKPAMKRNWLPALHRVAQSPLLNFFSGLILLVTGMLECVATLVEGWYEIPIGSHHGIAIFGFLQMIRALPDAMKGLGFIEAGELQAADSQRMDGQAAPAPTALQPQPKIG